MSQRKVKHHKVALVGNPNCGKTALFNAITGGHSKVGNYPGVTVERKEGSAISPSGQVFEILDLPGTYSIESRTPDEKITRDVLLGLDPNEPAPEGLIAVADATSLERSLALVLEILSVGAPKISPSLQPPQIPQTSIAPTPMVLVLNMMDLAQKRGLELDLDILSRELGIPVVATVATQKRGIRELLKTLDILLPPGGLVSIGRSDRPCSRAIDPSQLGQPQPDGIQKRFAEVDRILTRAVLKPSRPSGWTDRIDHLLLHPVWGSIFLVLILGFVFQAVFTWAQVPMDYLKDLNHWAGEGVRHLLPAGPLNSLVVDGVIAGVGSILVFLPQILLLFLFILVLEDSGYMSRAAFLMDRIMGKVGLHGRAFIPLLSSFACAIPGIMATRTIENRRDRLTTILVAPLMTCSARLPVYSLLIAAFIPNRLVFGVFRLQGLVMLGLYFAGISAALVVALVLRKALLKGPKPPLLMELPTYKWPNIRNLMLGLWERCRLFVGRAGTVILTISILLWFLASYPKPPPGSAEPAITFSYAGRMGQALEPLVRPIGFNWKIAVALIPGFAAREVMISSLATVYSIEEQASKGNSEVSGILSEKLAKDWSVATALSLLVWYILACQCLSTLAVTRKETNSWRWPGFMLAYMTCLAYGGSFLTYQIALKLGLG